MSRNPIIPVDGSPASFDDLPVAARLATEIRELGLPEGDLTSLVDDGMLATTSADGGRCRRSGQDRFDIGAGCERAVG